MMRSSTKITRVQLKVNQNSESVLAGIVSSEPDYKLSLSINRKLKISLRSNDPVVVSYDKGTELCYSRFSDMSSSHGPVELISNRIDKNFLIRKLRNIDYIFHLHGTGDASAVEKIISLLKGTESVTAVFIINHKTLKDKNLHHIIQ